MAIIYHISTAREWQEAQAAGAYRAASLETEGFIHASTAAQVSSVLHRYFKGQSNLLRLEIDTDKLDCPLVYELSPSVNEEFPHLYGPLNLDAVTDVRAIEAQ